MSQASHPKAPESLNCTCVLEPHGEPPPPPEAEIVISSVVALVVIVTFVPATRVKVSLVVSATTFDCPDTAIVEKIDWSHVFVHVAVPPHVATSASDIAVLSCETVKEPRAVALLHAEAVIAPVSAARQRLGVASL